MRIGIISNSDECIPLAYTLATQGLQVNICLSPPQDPFIFQKTTGWLQSSNIPFVLEGDVYHWMEQTHPDILFVFGYKQLLDISRISIPAFNIHGGALPAFRGPVPVFWQLKQGQPFLELSIHRLSAKFDDGVVVWTKQTENLPHYNYSIVQQLFSHLCVEGVLYIIQHLSSLETKTNGGVSAYHKRPQLEDVLINWKEMKGVGICDLVRACNPWNKGALTFFNKQEVKIMDAQVVNVSTKAAAGTILNDHEFLLVACADGKVININMLFTNEFFMPAYQSAAWGFIKGKVFG
jgi:methionyl-tRNA formyltransferase